MLHYKNSLAVKESTTSGLFFLFLFLFFLSKFKRLHIFVVPLYIVL